jgi:hypothetical protein
MKTHLFPAVTALLASTSFATLATIEWDFARGPADLEVALEGGTKAIASVTLESGLGEGWHNDWNLGSAVGYWDLGPGGSISLQIPVRTTLRGAVDMTVTVVQWVHPPWFEDALTCSVGGAFPKGTPGTIVVEDTDFGSWMQCRRTLTYSAVPGLESITITAPPTGAIIDRICVDNALAVVPEPSGILVGLLVCGFFGLSFLRRRRPCQSVGRTSGLPVITGTSGSG